MLGIVGWKRSCGCADTASYCVFVEVYGTVVVEDCLALASYWNILESRNAHLLERSVM